MKNKKDHTELSYNYQIAVGNDSGIILAGSITQDPTDHHQLQPQIKHFKENVGPLPLGTEVSSDNGHYTGETSVT